MCGIVGFITVGDTLAEQEKRHFMRHALALDTLRGADSTGIIAVRKEFDVYMAHTTMAGDQYVHDDHYREFMKDPAWAVIGHNRAATRGSVKLENAHPFSFGDVTMVHNGTLYQMGRSLPTFDSNLEVDSMQIAKALSEAGPDDVGDVLKSIDGSFALVWTDARNETVNIARNSSRPFHFTFNTPKTAMWFMSDGHHLNTINRSFGRSHFGGGTIYQLDRMKHIQFKKGSPLSPKVTTFSEYQRPKPVTQPSQHHGARTGYGTNRSAAGSHLLNTAADRWRQHMQGRKGTPTPTKDSETPSTKIVIAGRRREIPPAQVKALKDFYELEPGKLARFVPEDMLPTGKHTCVVFGEMVHEGWGDTPWDMVLYDVPKVVWEDCRKRDWVVRVTGVGHPVMKGVNFPSLLGALYHNDYVRYYDTTKPYAVPTPKDHTCENEDDPAKKLCVGPEERLVNRGKLEKMMESGCAQCGAQLTHTFIKQAMYVNEGRDLLCHKCVDEWDNATGAVQ